MRIKDRIKEFRRVNAKELRANPRNWRRHPQRQRSAMMAVLKEIGYADAVLARELEDGTLELIDGHMRVDLTKDCSVPVLILDVTEDEAKQILALHDPIGAMATQDSEALKSLIEDIDRTTSDLKDILEDVMHVPKSATIEVVETRPSPKMAWVLIGLPLVRYGEIAATVEMLSDIDGIVVMTNLSDYEP